MKGAFLDWDSLKGEELDTTGMLALPVSWTFYPKIESPELEQEIAQYDILVSNKVILDQHLLQLANSLKLICVAATGTNNIDLAAASELNIPVCNVTAYASDSVVQHVFMLMFMLLRQYQPYANDVRNGKWQKSPYFCLLDHPIISARNRTLGIIGYGELGRSVASTARNFGMNVIISESLQKNARSGAKDRVPLDTVLAESDVISLHCPLSTETRNLIDRQAFVKMKDSAMLINTARGGIVNEADLLDALKQKQIAGAALDVLETEPPVENHPLLNASLDNLIITPHIAWAGLEARQMLLDNLVNNIHNWLSGNIFNQVNA